MCWGRAGRPGKGAAARNTSGCSVRRLLWLSAAGTITPLRLPTSRNGGAGMSERVLLADDHAVFRQGLRALLEKRGLEVVGEAADGQAAGELTQRLRPDVVVLDIVIPRLNGVEAAHHITPTCPGVGGIPPTMPTEDHYVLGAVRDRVRGLVTKTPAA